MARDVLAARTAIGAALLLGGGSLALFAAFLLWGPLAAVDLALPAWQALAWDAALSVLFFVQHSGMVRTPFRARAARFVPSAYLGALYAVASGIALLAVVLLWQETPPSLVRLEGVPRALARGVALLAALGFVWAVRALGGGDIFGVAELRAHSRRRPARPPDFVVRGPYLVVRHPLYALILVLVWSAPDVTVDRLLFDLVWTAWIVAGAHLEERDLVAAFGERYRRYRSEVPMLLPLRARGRARHAGS